MAHITGGGFIENIPRILPEGLAIVITKGSWPVPPIFSLIQEDGNVDNDEMFRAFNMGIGMAVICDGNKAQALAELAAAEDIRMFRIGEVAKGEGGVEIV